jgi:hypothetical protein
MMRRGGLATLAVLAVSITPAIADPAQPVIGTATMASDRTITLDLYGDKSADYAAGHLQYKTTDKDYAAVLAHLGGLKPGERKPVTAWPTQDSH